uniref:Pyridoxal-dependent decarboxylase, C-terminal sheet domain protein n=1 Tax=Megaviridae environmental sample TaxID=1737588 RepID=A0A5J6VJE6_9VIRU|nr:MAG: pyridoxal-dependent decarboxylase, C-terminal sheet domain protein [Megaviridae environmental sample]
MRISTELIKDIAKKFGTPFYLYDEKGIRETCFKLFDAMRQENINYKNYFAVKALPNPHILKILHEEGMLFDCSNKNEIKLLDLIHANNNSINSYAGNFSTDFKYAQERNYHIVFDDPVSQIPQLDVIPKSCSIRVETEYKKFGIMEKDLDACIKMLQDKTSILGIHSMACWNEMQYEQWNNHANNLIKLAENSSINRLNVGGGFGINYHKMDNFGIDFYDLAKIFSKAFKGFDGLIASEFGRAITGEHGILVAKCTSKKVCSTRGVFYGLDACMSHLMRPGMYSSYHKITIPERHTLEHEKANVVGFLCEDNDWFCKDRILPRAQVGDLFVIHDTGAHGHSMCFQYNSTLRAPEILLDLSGNPRLIRSRETFNDLIYNINI